MLFINIIIIYYILFNLNIIFNLKRKDCDLLIDFNMANLVSIIISAIASLPLVAITNQTIFNLYFNFVFIIYLISFIIMFISFIDEDNIDVYDNLIEYLLLINHNIIYKNNYIYSSKLDFKTSIDNIKITDSETLEHLAIINNKLIPNYDKVYKLEKKLKKHNSNQDKTIKMKKDIKNKILNEIELINTHIILEDNNLQPILLRIKNKIKNRKQHKDKEIYQTLDKINDEIKYL